MNTPALHPRTQLAVQRFVAMPSHSVMIIGEPGAGKRTLAIHLANQVIDPAKDVQKSPYFLLIHPTNKAISIEAIRQAHEFVRLKTTGDQKWRRAIIVEDAHYLTVEAQNAFLKLLEEPPDDTIIILTVTNENSVLPTIRSRTQQLTVKPLSAEAAEELLVGQGYDSTQVTRTYHMSSGYPGLMTTLLDQENNKELLGYIDSAKEFLKADSFGRLVFIDQFTKQKDSVEDFLWALMTVSKVALKQAGRQDKPTLVARWQKSIEAILQAKDALPAHPLPKLLLTDLSLQI